jgi:hypothetical protein
MLLLHVMRSIFWTPQTGAPARESRGSNGSCRALHVCGAMYGGLGTDYVD